MILLVKLKEPANEHQKMTFMPPLGLWSIKENVNDLCVVVDEHLGEGALEDALIYYHPEIVGISAQFSIQHKEVIKAIRLSKKYTKNILVGGFHARYVTEEDVKICHGMGENCVRKAIGQDPLKFPSMKMPKPMSAMLHSYWDRCKPHDLKTRTGQWMPIETSRGCPYSCGFCGANEYWGNWHGRRLEDIEDALDYYSSIGVRELYIEDDNISIDKERFQSLIYMFNLYDMYWSTPNGISPKHLLRPGVLESLKGSTCWRLSLAFEAGNPWSAYYMGIRDKYVDRDTAEWLVEQLEDMGIETCGFFVIGYPPETIVDVLQTLEYANSLPLSQRNIYIATPYPGTKLYDLCKKQGYLACDGEELYEKLRYTKGLINTPWLSGKRLEEIKFEDREKAIGGRK